jgi:hypothetical protein
MTAPAECLLIGKWRITEADLWDSEHLNLVEPAYVIFHKDGRGEIAFGALQAGLDLEYARSLVFFTWAGFEEMDEVTGSGSAELNDDGTISVEFAYHLGDEAELKARRW